MRSMRALGVAGVLSLAVAASALIDIGVNDIFGLNRDGTAGIVPALTTDRATFTATADLAKVDAALATLDAASTSSVTDNVTRLTAAFKQLGKLGLQADKTPKTYETEAVNTLYFQVYGYNAQGGAAASTYFGKLPTTIGNASKLFKIVAAGAKRIKSLEATQGTGKNAGWTLAKKLKLYLSVSKASDALIKKYGT